MAPKKKPPATPKPPKGPKAPRKPKRAGGHRAAVALREAITAALNQDRELIPDGAATSGRKNKRSGAHPTFRLAADALEPVLADAVRQRPSFLGRFALGTAQLLGTLATEDRSSNRRLAEIAAGSHVGIVFVDVVGFTAYTESNGDDAAVALVKNLEDLVDGVCRRLEGEVVKHLGDGFLLAFGSASRAVRGGLALRDAVRKARSADPSIQNVRIAVHAGRPSVVEDDLIGHDVNLTARLLEYCEPGEVLVTAEAMQLASKRLRTVRFSRPRRVSPRGVPESILTYDADAG